MAIFNSESEEQIIYPNEEIKRDAHVSSIEEYKRMYKWSIEDPDEFWSEIASDFRFERPNGIISNHNSNELNLKYNFDMSNGPVYVKWMQGAKTNICYNVVDRIVERGFGERIAYYW